MLREFVKLVEDVVDEGFDRGINLFMETLEEDLAKTEMITENGGVDSVLANIFESSGYSIEEDFENLDEQKIDALLDHFKKEGI